MTLYYTKLNPDELSAKLDDAMQKRQQKSQSEMIGFIANASRQDLEKAIAYNASSSLDILVKKKGIGFHVMDYGICPVSGKCCHEGLAVTDPSTGIIRYQSIPGGAANCCRCRFFITGPAFLFGLEAHVNDLSYRLKNASSSFNSAQTKYDTLSDSYAKSLDSKEPFFLHRDLDIAEAKYEATTFEVDSIALSLQAAYTLVEHCIKINNQQKSEDSPLSLVTVGGSKQIQALFAEGHQFEHLNRICLSATIYDGLKIDWKLPNLERARLYDRMFKNSGYQPWLSLLNDNDSLKIANEMSKFLYARLDSSAVHSLIDGRTTLRAIGIEQDFFQKLSTGTELQGHGVFFSSSPVISLKSNQQHS